METSLLLKKTKEMLPEQVDYAEMVGAPSFAYGKKYCYEDEWGYICEDVIEKLEKLERYELKIDKEHGYFYNWTELVGNTDIERR